LLCRLTLLTIAVVPALADLDQVHAQAISQPYGGLTSIPPVPPDSAAPDFVAQAPLVPVLSAPPQNSPDWLVTPYLSLSESYTDNVRLTPHGTPDFLTSTTPGASVQGRTRRLQATVDGNVTYDAYARANDLDGYRYTFNGNALGEIVENYLFLDVRSSVGAEPVNANGGVPAFERSVPGNQVQVIDSSISPYFAHDFGSWGSGLLRYRESLLDYSDANTNSRVLSPTPAGLTPVALSNSNTQEVVGNLKAGPRFTTYRWAVDASSSTTDYASSRTVQQNSGTLTGEYAVIRELAVVGKLGEDSFKDTAISSTTNVDPSWRVGARVTPGPRTDFLAEAGRRFGGPYWSGQFRYLISKTLTVSASHEETLATEQQLSNDDLNQLTRDDQGRLANPLTGEIVDPNNNGFNYVGQSFSLKTSRIALNGVDGRNSADISAEYDQRAIGANSLGQDGVERQDIILLGGSVSRQLNRQSDASLSLSVGRNSDSLATGSYKIFQAGSAYDYEFLPTLRGTLAYRYYDLSNTIASGYHENAILASIRKTF
jgi:uncharacterized protein (PEP-CTERM system associated)